MYRGTPPQELLQYYLSNTPFFSVSILFIFVFACHIIFRVSGFYLSKRFSSNTRDMLDITKAILFLCVMILGAGYIFNLKFISTQFVFFFFCISFCILISFRLFMNWVLYLSRLRGRNLRYMIILGTNAKAVQVANTIRDRKKLGFIISGFLDDDWPGLEAFKRTRYPLLGDLNSFAEYLRKNVVDEVLVCLPVKSLYSESQRIISICEEHGVIVRFVSNIFGLNRAKLRHEFIGSELMITQYNSENIYHLHSMIKRLLDITVGMILLIALSPLFSVVALIIKVTSRGPVFFAQKRVGLNKRIFKMYKFRSMIQNAENLQKDLEKYNEISGPVFKIKDDPRITPFGKFIRKTSIDELPQLLNVLKGEMSLVGPRPLPIRDFKGFEKDWHRRRFSVVPGLTCLWQIYGRNNVDFNHWMELDLKYIDNWSFFLDLKILFLTIPAVLKKKGAS